MEHAPELDAVSGLDAVVLGPEAPEDAARRALRVPTLEHHVADPDAYLELYERHSWARRRGHAPPMLEGRPFFHEREVDDWQRPMACSVVVRAGAARVLRRDGAGAASRWAWRPGPEDRWVVPTALLAARDPGPFDPAEDADQPGGELVRCPCCREDLAPVLRQTSRPGDASPGLSLWRQLASYGAWCPGCRRGFAMRDAVVLDRPLLPYVSAYDLPRGHLLERPGATYVRFEDDRHRVPAGTRLLVCPEPVDARVLAEAGAGQGRKRERNSQLQSSYLGRFPLVLADFWTSDHLLERSRSVDALLNARARNNRVEANLNPSFPAQVIPDLGALPGLPRPERYGGYAYMAIFDGHDGDACASFLQHELHGHLCRQAQFFGDARAAVARAFREADDEACARLRADDDASGSTAVVALFDGGSNKLLVAHCGDSRAVLSVSGGCALPLTQDHRLTRPDELARIRNAGGLVVNHRLNGSLAVSRSFGDVLHKDAATCPTLTAAPEVAIRALDDEDEFVVVGCDGLWDTLSMQTVTNFVRAELQRHRDLQRAAKALTEEAIARGSVDNVSVIIVALHQGPGSPKHAQGPA